MARLHLSPADRDSVTAAVTLAERGTDGEIVTILTESSDGYHDVALHYAIGAVLLTTAVAAIRPEWLTRLATLFHGDWAGDVSLGNRLFALLVVQAVVFLIVRLLLAGRRVRVRLTPRAIRARRVRRRAVQYFKVGAERRTEARVGILLFLSLDEQIAEIVADEAIHGLVAADAWGEAMAALVGRLRDGDAAAGMAAAVARIGVVLAQHFPKTATDLNELPDRLIEL